MNLHTGEAIKNQIRKEFILAKKSKKRKHYREENGQGSWYFDEKKDSFRYIVTLNFNGESKRKAFYGKTKQECLEKLDVYLEKEGLIKNEYSVLSTIPDIMKTVYTIEHNKGYTHESAYQRNLDTVKKIESGRVGKIPIKDITRLDLERYLSDITCLSDSYIGKIWRAIKTAYATAEYHNIITKNFFDDPSFKKPKSTKPKKKVIAFSIDEQELFIKELAKAKTKKGSCSYIAQFLIELSLGMRMGEINALSVADIVFNQDGSGTINVKKTISTGESKRPFLKFFPKTDAGNRAVEFDSQIGCVIKNAIENMKPNKYDLIFYNHNTNSVISTAQVNDSFSRLCKKAGLKSYGQHMLRHTFATRCIERGVPAEVLSKWLGHSDITTTLNTYVDVFRKHEAKYSKSSYNLSGVFDYIKE